MKHITACRVCQSSDIKSFFDLGMQPFANSLLSGPDEKENSYPLSLSWCPSCNLVQLNDTADPKELFSHYVWVTGTSSTAQEYSGRFYKEVVARAGQPKTGYVLEAASNDGTFLAPFLSNGLRVLGVDPAANIAEMARERGIPTMCAFWGRETAEKVRAEHGPAHIVVARNVLPHVANTHDFVDGLRAVLHEEGTLAIEIHYAKTILEGLHYDSIYHEHLCYFTLKSIERLLNHFGLYVFDIGTSPISGGSIVVYASTRRKQESPQLDRYRKQEAADGTNDLVSWEKFASQSFAHRDRLREMLMACAAKGSVVGYGASARSSTLLNFCGIDRRLVPLIADQNTLKQGKYTPGTRILIDSPENVMRCKPAHVFILAWNFADEIIGILQNRFGFGGSFIIPLPASPHLRQAQAMRN